MREILFRGKRKDNDEWIYGYYVNRADVHDQTEDTVTEIIEVGDYRVCAEEYSYTDSYLYTHRVVPESVGQYINREDINGNRIFEGDIIRIHNDYNGDLNPFNAVVEYIDGAFVSRSGRSNGYNHFDAWNIPYVWWEVVGNIHDNPEFVERSK